MKYKKYKKNLSIVAIACFVISVVHYTKKQHMSAQTQPLPTVALATIDDPDQDGLKTKIFTIIDKSKNTGQSTR